MGDLTVLIGRAHAGDAEASAKLFTQVYAELKHIAERQVRRLVGAPLHATTLVHEAYLRLAKPEALNVSDRSHFFAVAGRAMRQLLIDEVRARAAVKRSDDRALPLEALPAEALAAPQSDVDVLALEQALNHLNEIEPELARLVEMRFYAGLELSDIAQLTQRSERSLKRDWRRARAFLHAQLAQVKLTTEALPP